MSEFPVLPILGYSAARTMIQSGDVMLASGAYTFSKLIQKATGSPWSHAAFVMRLDTLDRVMVLESIESRGVRTLPLSEYISNFEGTGKGYNGRLAILRHKRFEELATPEGMKRMAQFAVDRFAYPYDEEEIARITTRIVGAHLGFTNGELKRNNEFICSEYVYECYKALGIDVVYDKRGFVAPADFARDSNLDILFEINISK